MAQNITEANFDSEVIASEVPVLVDFWAQWCGPCKMLAPIIDQIATEVEGQYKVVKVDVDAAPAIAARYNVRSIPTLVYIKGGEVVDTTVGASSKDAILTRLKSL